MSLNLFNSCWQVSSPRANLLLCSSTWATALAKFWQLALDSSADWNFLLYLATCDFHCLQTSLSRAKALEISAKIRIALIIFISFTSFLSFLLFFENFLSFSILKSRKTRGAAFIYIRRVCLLLGFGTALISEYGLKFQKKML